MPNNEYYEYYGPDYDLDVRASNMTDHNTPKYLEKLKQNVFEILRDKDAAPSVPLQRKLLGPSCTIEAQLMEQRYLPCRTTTTRIVRWRMKKTKTRE
jgi:hypothetical protein